MKKFYFLSLFLTLAIVINAQTTVTFAVDMNGVAEFDPAVDVMKIGGNFQGWSPDDTVMEDADGNGVYSVTVDGVTETNILFKFVINAWETNEFHPDTPGTPGDCTVDDGAGNVNRSEDISGDTFELPVYVYNSCDVSDVGIVSVNNLTTITDVTIAPNPATDYININYANTNNATHDILVTSITGQVMKQFNSVAGNNLTVDTKDLAAGMYFVTFRNDQGEQGSEKFIVR